MAAVIPRLNLSGVNLSSGDSDSNGNSNSNSSVNISATAAAEARTMFKNILALQEVMRNSPGMMTIIKLVGKASFKPAKKLASAYLGKSGNKKVISGVTQKFELFEKLLTAKTESKKANTMTPSAAAAEALFVICQSQLQQEASKVTCGLAGGKDELGQPCQIAIGLKGGLCMHHQKKKLPSVNFNNNVNINNSSEFQPGQGLDRISEEDDDEGDIDAGFDEEEGGDDYVPNSNLTPSLTPALTPMSTPTSSSVEFYDRVKRMTASAPELLNPNYPQQQYERLYPTLDNRTSTPTPTPTSTPNSTPHSSPRQESKEVKTKKSLSGSRSSSSLSTSLSSTSTSSSTYISPLLMPTLAVPMTVPVPALTPVSTLKPAHVSTSTSTSTPVSTSSTSSSSLPPVSGASSKRCCAKIGKGTKCTRNKADGSDYCGQHTKQAASGNVTRY